MHNGAVKFSRIFPEMSCRRVRRLQPKTGPYAPSGAQPSFTFPASDGRVEVHVDAVDGGGSGAHVHPAGQGEPHWGRKWLIALTAVFATVAATVGIALIPVPYVVQDAGPTVDVLSKQGEVQVIQISPAEGELGLQPRDRADGDGQLRMVTVAETGGPGSTVRVADLVTAWLRPSTTILPYGDVYAEETTADQVKQASQAQMVSSHSTAAIAAMEYLQVPVDTTLTVVGAVPGGASDGLLEEGDVLVSLTTPDGVVHAVDRPSVPFTLLKTVPAQSPVEVTVLRGGKEETVQVVTQASPGSDSGSKLGIYLDAETEMPLDVEIHLERIGGPSAGLIFALGIVDQLGDHDITNGQVIAGTGALDFAADVHPIGGVKQKMHAAVRDGADWFLAPEANCVDVIGNEPQGLHVVPVATFEQALEAVEAIGGGEGETLPTCATMDTASAA